MGFLGLSGEAMQGLGVGLLLGAVALLAVAGFLWGRSARPAVPLMALTGGAVVLLGGGLYLAFGGGGYGDGGGVAMQHAELDHEAMGHAPAADSDEVVTAPGAPDTPAEPGVDGAVPEDVEGASEVVAVPGEAEEEGHGEMEEHGVTDAIGTGAEAMARAEEMHEERALYELYCAACHGDGGRGDGALAEILPVRPADIIAHLGHHPDHELVEIILDGVPPAMPATRIEEEEARRIVRYLRALPGAGHHPH